MFLRLREKKSKFRYLFRKGHDKNELQKEVSSCVERRYNGFYVTIHMCEKNRQVDFESVDVIYEPVKRLHEIIEYYFTNKINQAFIVRYQGSKINVLNSTTGSAYYYCDIYCISKKVFEKHLRVCAKKTRSSLQFQ